MPYPQPTLDHVVINVRDRLDEAAALYQRLGFNLTPRGYHSLGSINHLAMFGTDYLELIAVPQGKTDRFDILQFAEGLNGLVFGTENADRLYAELVKAGVAVQPPNHFVRPVALESGPQDAAFSTVRLAREAVPSGRVYFCQHFTRDLVWRDEWRGHANGVVGISAFTIRSATPQQMGDLFTAIFGPGSVQPIPGGLRLIVGLSSCDVVTPEEVQRRYASAAPTAASATDDMTALTFRTRSLGQTAAALIKGGIPFQQTDSRIVVAATQTMGATLEFTA